MNLQKQHLASHIGTHSLTHSPSSLYDFIFTVLFFLSNYFTALNYEFADDFDETCLFIRFSMLLSSLLLTFSPGLLFIIQPDSKSNKFPSQHVQFCLFRHEICELSIKWFNCIQIGIWADFRCSAYRFISIVIRWSIECRECLIRRPNITVDFLSRENDLKIDMRRHDVGGDLKA